MQTQNATTLFTFTMLCAGLALAAADTDATSSGAAVSVEAGIATFIANTNVSAISVKGKSTNLQAKVAARRTPEGLELEHIEATLPVRSLNTGMGVRDEHMRKYIFTTSDGKEPDIRFEAANVSCPGAGSGKEATCKITGNLAIRGVPKPFAIALKIRDEHGGFKAAGDGSVKLSDYGIEQPSQFGVKTTNEVQIHLEFSAREGGSLRASAGGRQ